jgi:hypothetical protein
VTQNSGRTEERVARILRSEETPIPMYYFKGRKKDERGGGKYYPGLTQDDSSHEEA